MRFRRVTGVSLWVLAPALAGCAARGPSASTTAQLARADALVRAGCHACLLEALDVYETMAAAPRVDRARIARASFDAAILLAFRSKELGLPADAALDRADRTAALLPGDAGVAALLAAARLWPGDISALDNEDRQARMLAYWRAQNSPARQARDALDGVVPRSLAVSYAALALDCDVRSARDALVPTAVLASGNEAPALRFRLALCGPDATSLLAGLEDADPRWAPELAFVTGRAMTGNVRDMREGATRLAIAAAAFQESGAIRLALAGVQRALRDLEAALVSYDAVVAQVPTQRDALLGRVICLTYLKRPEQAIEGATRLLDLGSWLIGDAYYWRAWNRFQLRRLDEAWEDVEQAITRMANTNVFTLAGLVAYNRRDLDAARDRFERAWKMDAGNCDAISYLGIVRSEQETWPIAAEVFSSASTCAASAAAKAARDLADLEGSDQPEDFKVRQAAEFRTIIVEMEQQAATAAYNAGNAYARSNNRDAALTKLDEAARHPAMKEKAEALRSLLAPR